MKQTQGLIISECSERVDWRREMRWSEIVSCDKLSARLPG